MNPTLKKFFRLFWSDEVCRSIFLLHKEQLLEKQEINTSLIKTSYYLPRFVLSNSKERIEAAEVLKDRLGARNIDIDYSLESLMTRNFDESKIEKYFESNIFRPFKKLLKKFEEEDGIGLRFLLELIAATSSEKRLLNFLKKYEVIDDRFATMKEVEKHLTTFVEEQLKNILKSEHFRDFFFGLDGMAAYYNNAVFESLMDANRIQTDRIFNDENYKDRNKLFDQLYDKHILTSGRYLTYYECVECDEGVFSGSVKLKVRPSKVKLHCPNCAKEVLYLAPYEINHDIFDLIKSDDGVISGAIQFALDEHKVTYSLNQKLLHDIELDIAILDKEGLIEAIIECKMFKTDRPADTQISNLRQALSQVKKIREKLGKHDEGFLRIPYLLLTNISDSVILDAFKRECKEDLKANNITVYEIMKFKERLSEKFND